MDHDLNGFSTTGRESPHRRPNRINLTRPNTPPLCKTKRAGERGGEVVGEWEGITGNAAARRAVSLSAPNQHNSNWR